MNILLVNPNTTASMTEKALAAAQNVAHADTTIIGATSQNGPASIQGYLDAANCVPGLLAEVKAHQNHHNIDAIVIACFDDTGLDAVRCITSAPVLGIGEAAFHAASMVANKFAVVTTLSRSVPGLEANLMRYGLAQKCVGVRASDIPVLKLEENDPASLDRIRNEIRIAITDTHAEAIVLGCAGMAPLMAQLSDEYGLPVIDGVAAGITLAEAMVRCGLTTSKKGAYAVD